MELYSSGSRGNKEHDHADQNIYSGRERKAEMKQMAHMIVGFIAGGLIGCPGALMLLDG